MPQLSLFGPSQQASPTQTGLILPGHILVGGDQYKLLSLIQLRQVGGRLTATTS